MAKPVPAALIEGAREELWRRGDLQHKCHAAQKIVYAAIAASNTAKFYLNISRQWGKSYVLLLIAFEYCIKNANSLVLYFAPYAKDAAEVATERARTLTADCPKHLMPEYSLSAKELKFPNGSRIRFIGANNEHAQFARGVAMHLGIVDEAALIDGLDHLVKSIMTPMTLTTGGRILLASTPAVTPGHESTVMAKECQEEDAYAHFTIYDNPMATPAMIARFKKECGGENTTAWKREYLADLNVVEEDLAVVPEFNLEAQADIVREVKRPDFYDRYVSMDPGFNDRTGIVFGYWDFNAGYLVIEDEALLKNAGTPDIAVTIKAREKLLWGDAEPFIRVCDTEPRLRADLYTLHGLAFSPAIKSDSEGSINMLRHWVQARKIRIHPRCRKLVLQLRNATYGPNGKDFERTKEHGHYDLVAALKYLTRMVVPTRNPFPDHYFRPAQGQYSRDYWFQQRSLGQGLFPDTPFAKRVLEMERARKRRA